MDLNAGDAIDIGVGIVITLTLFVVLLYAWQAWRQAKATERIAESTMRPVISVRSEPQPPGDLADGYPYRVYYRNIGNGPAVNMAFRLSPDEGKWLEPPRRVGMGLHEAEASILVKVPLPIPETGLSVVADYLDVSGSKWRTTLKLDNNNGVLVNGESNVEKIGT